MKCQYSSDSCWGVIFWSPVCIVWNLRHSWSFHAVCLETIGRSSWIMIIRWSSCFNSTVAQVSSIFTCYWVLGIFRILPLTWNVHLLYFAGAWTVSAINVKGKMNQAAEHLGAVSHVDIDPSVLCCLGMVQCPVAADSRRIRNSERRSQRQKIFWAGMLRHLPLISCSLILYYIYIYIISILYIYILYIYCVYMLWKGYAWWIHSKPVTIIYTLCKFKAM